MDVRLFLDILNIDSTSGREGELAGFLAERLMTSACRLVRFDDNLLFIWGEPKVVFCTHIDTVPPYIPPVIQDGALNVASGGSAAEAVSSPITEIPSHVIQWELSNIIPREPSHVIPRERSDRGNPLADTSNVIHGRGTCDAKGQLMAMYEACLELERRGCSDFALLLLTGEETGSFGAKAFNKVAYELLPSVSDVWLVVGEPTDNMMASAAKGTKAFEVEFTGVAFHSGYPEYGRSAVMMFNDFVNAIRSIGFPYDETLGPTTWNIGRLHSDNPQNILSDHLSCRVYFRTTFESDEMVCNVMKNMAGPDARLRFGRPKVQDGSDIVSKEVAQWQKSMKVTALGGDSPTRFDILDGFPSKPVSFGSDAPQLTCFPHRILCGPGSILVAHRDNEHIRLADLAAATENYVRMYDRIIGLD